MCYAFFKPPVKLGLFLINQEKQEQPQVSLQSCVEQSIHLTLTSIDFMNFLTDEILTTGEKNIHSHPRDVPSNSFILSVFPS